VYTAETQTDGYNVAVASIAFPDRLSSVQMQSALDAAFKERISVAGGTLERKDLTMRDKLPAVEGRFNRNGVHAHMLIVASGSALVLIAVTAKSGTDRLYNALEASLIVG
jgi:ABC-type phosphate transport system auxiliary subunit